MRHNIFLWLSSLVASAGFSSTVLGVVAHNSVGGGGKIVLGLCMKSAGPRLTLGHLQSLKAGNTAAVKFVAHMVNNSQNLEHSAFQESGKPWVSGAKEGTRPPSEMIYNVDVHRQLCYVE